MNIQTRVPTIYGGLIEKFSPLWEKQIEQVKTVFSDDIESIQMPTVDPVEVPVIFIKKEKFLDVLQHMKTECGYSFLVDYTATDEETDPRFRLVVNLFDHNTKARIRLKTNLKENESMPTLIPLWEGANWAEREIFDMFGIRFDGHPDLRRILMDIRWEGHPLRKDYPLRGYQIFLTPEPIDPELLK